MAAELDPKTSRLLDEAIDLIIRRQNAPDNTVTERTIALWRERSHEHERIWQRVAQAHGMSGAALRPSAKEGRLSRRNLLAGGALALAAGGLGTWAIPRLRLGLMADHVTHTAEVKSLDLPDGTKVTLGPDTAIALASGTTRHARLLQGMAWLEVAPQDNAPFVLDVDGGPQIRTKAARFDVSLDAGTTSLAVASHELALDGPSAQILAAGQWLRLHRGTGAQESGMQDQSLAGAWVGGSIIAEAEPLESLVSKIARWLPERVIIAEAAIARTRISGLFDVTAPRDALEAAVRPTGAKLRQLPGLFTVISSV